MNTDPSIPYWLKNQSVQNLGGLLSEVLFEALTAKSRVNWRQGGALGDYDVVRLIGSVISESHIERDLEYSRTAAERPIAFWGCGLRGYEPLRRDLTKRCAFLGVGGPLTRDVLGLPRDTAIGDPALLIPFLYTPRLRQHFVNKMICVPHFLEQNRTTNCAL